MLGREVICTMLMVFLLNMLVFGVALRPVRAMEAIYILSDGSIAPSSAPIIRDGDVYTLSGNITSDVNGLVIERSNMTLDGAGYTVQGTGVLYSKGVYLYGTHNVTVKNITIAAFSYGIFLNSSSDNTICKNSITSNWDGIYLWLSSNRNVIVENNVTSNALLGMYVYSSSNNNITRNRFADNSQSGIYLDWFSSGNSISGNSITANSQYGIYSYWYTSNNSIFENNITANQYTGVSLGYFSDRNTISRNNIVSNLNRGLIFSSFSDYNIISQNNITESMFGIDLHYSSNNIIKANIIAENSQFGARLFDSSNDSIYHNNFANNTNQVYLERSASSWNDSYPLSGNYWSDYSGADANGDGMGDAPYAVNEKNIDYYPLMHPWAVLPVHNMNTGLGYATIQQTLDAPETLDAHVIFVESGTYYENVVVNRTVSLIGEDRDSTVIDGNYTGDAVVRLYADKANIRSFTIRNSGASTTSPLPGLGVYYASDFRVSHITVINNDCGIFFYSASNGTVSECNVANNTRFGVYLLLSSGNKIYHNNIDNNTQQVFSDGSSQLWYDGYPSGGNYWSNYTGVDLLNGPFQNETQGDGIGDTLYVIDASNIDVYPLMDFWPPPDIEVLDVTPSKIVVGQGYSLYIDVTVENRGVRTETFNITVSANATTVGRSTNVTLAGGNSTIIAVTWSTVGFSFGNYLISAYAEPLLGEMIRTNNLFKADYVRVGIPGDINGDGVVDSIDLGTLGLAWGYVQGYPNYIPEADINGDGSVDSTDLGIMGVHWGET